MCFYVEKKDKDASAAVLKDLLIKKMFFSAFRHANQCCS